MLPSQFDLDQCPVVFLEDFRNKRLFACDLQTNQSFESQHELKYKKIKLQALIEQVYTQGDTFVLAWEENEESSGHLVKMHFGKIVIAERYL